MKHLFARIAVSAILPALVGAPALAQNAAQPDESSLGRMTIAQLASACETAQSEAARVMAAQSTAPVPRTDPVFNCARTVQDIYVEICKRINCERYVLGGLIYWVPFGGELNTPTIRGVSLSGGVMLGVSAMATSQAGSNRTGISFSVLAQPAFSITYTATRSGRNSVVQLLKSGLSLVLTIPGQNGRMPISQVFPAMPTSGETFWENVRHMQIGLSGEIPNFLQADLTQNQTMVGALTTNLGRAFDSSLDSIVFGNFYVMAGKTEGNAYGLHFGPMSSLFTY